MQEFIDKVGVSVVRTVVPIVVGFILAAAAKAGLHLDESWLTEALAPILSSAFYAIVRWLEVKGSPAWGWLLGKAQAPKYANGAVEGYVEPAAVEGVVVAENVQA